jgi:hypothetical protein
LAITTTRPELHVDDALSTAPSRKTRPIHVFASLGAVFLLIEAWVLTRWVTGPYFKTVPSGPSVPPTWMKIVQNVVQVAGPLAALAFIYVCLIRPWRRERRVTFDGLFCIASLTSAYQDPFSDYFGHWFTYSSYLYNKGSWVGVLPGWGFAKPGQTVAYPLLVVPPAYIWVFLGLMMIGCAVMRTAKARWPGLGPIGLIGVCLAFMAVADFFVEGMFFMRLGFWHYGGGHVSAFGGSYFKYPLNEMIFASTIFSTITCLRYFKNDKGQTLVERGVDTVRAKPWQRTALRFLAITAASHLAIGLAYNLPQALVGARSAAWPADVQRRSYMTNHICGAETDRACPGPGVPLPRPGSAHVNPSGNLVRPSGRGVSRPVPFDVGH